MPRSDDTIGAVIEIRVATLADWEQTREVRLRALREEPDAFGSTYAAELTLDDVSWQARASSGRQFLAVDGARVVGTATGWTVPDEPPSQRWLVGMWVDPRYRGRGLAGRLVDAVAGWARAEGARTLRLDVALGNGPARAAYLRRGFCGTGEITSMPRDPAILEERMTLPL